MGKVVICIDYNIRQYIDHVYNSIKKYTKDFEFYILCDKTIEKTDITYNEKYKWLFNIDIPEIDINKLNGQSSIRSKAMFYRFLAPYLIEGDKLIYTDTDVIFNADIRELWDMDMGDNLIAATEDQFNHENKHRPVELQTGENLEFEGKIYASGILIINSKLWREENIITEMIDMYNYYPMLDMLLMNIVCKGRIKELDYNWCIPANCVKDNYCKKNDRMYNPKCYHWHGPKPWDRYGALKNQLIYEKYL